MAQELKAGIQGRKELLVSTSHTATAYGSGTVDVFATPAMIGLMEQTAMESILDFLPEGHVTVGSEVNVKHLKGTLPGKTVVCHSELQYVEGKKLIFKVVAKDETGVIGEGSHTRYVVNKEKFINNLKG